MSNPRTTSHVTTIELHSIQQTVHIKLLQWTHRYMAQGLDPSDLRISILYVSVVVTAVRLNIIPNTVDLKIFGKPPLLRCGRFVRISCRTECCSAAPFAMLWCCCCLFRGISIVLLSYVSPQYFLQVFWEQFPPTAEVNIMLTVTRDMTIIVREVWCYVTISRDVRGKSKQIVGSILRQ